jgi:hypothetical protein
VARIDQSIEKGGATWVVSWRRQAYLHFMENLPVQTLDSLSPAARKEAYEKLARLCVARRDGIDSWDAVSRILKDPERRRVGLDYMIEQERRSAHGDPATET